MDMDAPAPVAIRLRRSTPSHAAYTVRIHDRRFTVLATAHPGDARRWVGTTRWLHRRRLLHAGGRGLVAGLGVQWTPTYRPLGGHPPVPATLQLCVGRRCLVFHLARAGTDAVPEALRRFLADPRVTFVGSGFANDCRILQAHYGLHVACGRELRALAGMGANASVEEMAGRVLGYPGIRKDRDVAVSDWHVERLSVHQVMYAAVDAYLAFRLGVHLLRLGPDQQQVRQATSPPPRAHPPPPPPPVVHHQANRPIVLDSPLPPGPRGIVLDSPLPPGPREIVLDSPLPPGPRGVVLESPLPPGPRGPVITHPPSPPPARPRDRDRVLVRSRQAPPDGRRGVAMYHSIPCARLASLASEFDTSDILVPLRPFSSDSDNDDGPWFTTLTDDEEEDS